MLLVSIGIFCIIVSVVSASKNKYVVMILSFLLGIVLCYSGLFLPVSGYVEDIIQEEQYLEKIIPEENIYVIQAKGNIAKYVVKRKDNHEEEKLVMYTNPKAEIFVVKNPIRPFVRKCLVKARRTIYTFALKPEEEQYKIYVNEHDIKME